MASECIVVLYSGGHAKQCIDIFLENECNIVCFDDCYSGETLEFYRSTFIIGNINDYHKFKKPHKVFCAAGDNSIRNSIVSKFPDAPWINCISKHSYISDGSAVGTGNYIGIHTKVVANSKVGNFNILNDGATVMHDCTVGNFTHLAPNSSLGGRVKIGSYVLIGTNAVVNPNACVPDNTIVGSQSVILKTIPDLGVKQTYIGVPACSRTAVHNFQN